MRPPPSSCVFCRIVAGDLAASVVLRDRDLGVVAFLDHAPLQKGHVLVVPERHAGTLLDATDAEVAAVFATARRVAGAVVRGLGAEGSFVAVNNVVSQSVPHLHVHVVPRRRGDGLKGFFWPRRRYADDEERDRTRAAIAAALG